MSLLHNVLREIDQRNSTDTLALPFMSAGQPQVAGFMAGRWWLLLPVLAIVCLLV